MQCYNLIEVHIGITQGALNVTASVLTYKHFYLFSLGYCLPIRICKYSNVQTEVRKSL
jgi:hypothetical protein